MLEIYAGIKLCGLANFEELFDIYLCVFDLIL